MIWTPLKSVLFVQHGVDENKWRSASSRRSPACFKCLRPSNRYVGLDCVASVPLALWHFGFSLPTPVGVKRTANFHVFLKFTLTVSPGVTL